MNATKTEKPAQFRRQGSSLFELDSEGRAYVHCYRNARLERAPIERLIAAYSESLAADSN